MKTAYLLHGTGGSGTDYFWFDDTKTYLESKGYSVWWPSLPNTHKPELNDSIYFLENNAPPFDEETIMIGHSSACPLLLSFMQYMKVQIKQVILVAGYYDKFEDNDVANLMLEPTYDWASIQEASDEIIMINSDNDPWDCTDQKARASALRLGAPLILTSGQGHMGSTTFEQPYREFDLLKRLIKL